MSNSEIVASEVSKHLRTLSKEIEIALSRKSKGVHEDYPEVVRRNKKLVDGLNGSMVRVERRELELLSLIEAKYAAKIKAVIAKNAG